MRRIYTSLFFIALLASYAWANKADSLKQNPCVNFQNELGEINNKLDKLDFRENSNSVEIDRLTTRRASLLRDCNKTDHKLKNAFGDSKINP